MCPTAQAPCYRDSKKRSLKLYSEKEKIEKPTAAEIIRIGRPNREEYAHKPKWKNVISFGLFFPRPFRFFINERSAQWYRCFFILQSGSWLWFHFAFFNFFFLCGMIGKYHSNKLLMAGMGLYDCCRLSLAMHFSSWPPLSSMWSAKEIQDYVKWLQSCISFASLGALWS